MFGWKNNGNLKINTIVGKDSVCHGDVFFEGSARVDGRIEGRVDATGTLIVGETGTIIGDIRAQAAVLGGSVEGNLNAAEKTELAATARVVGDITTGLLVVDENAMFQGRCNMNRPEAEDKKTDAAETTGAAETEGTEVTAETVEAEAATESEETVEAEAATESEVTEETVSTQPDQS